MAAALLLDTCALVWATIDEGSIHRSVLEEIADARRNDRVFLSPISAWEVAVLVRRGRLRIDGDVQDYVRDVFGRRGIRIAALTPAIAAAAETFDERTLRDPADRLIAATARTMGLRIVTRDRAFVELGSVGTLDVLRC